jgi:hypothetical protein
MITSGRVLLGVSGARKSGADARFANLSVRAES